MADITIIPNEYQIKALKLLSDPNIQVVGLAGGKGSSKSFCARLWIIQRMLKHSNARGMILRRSFDDLKRTFQDKIELEYAGCYQSYNNQTHTFHFANGSKLELAYAENESDINRLFGLELDSIVIDEMQFLEERVFHMLRTCLRTINPNIIPRMVVTWNWGGRSHAFLKRLFWDKNYLENEDPSKFAFLFGTIKDNPDLMKADPNYIKTLESLPEIERKLYLDGNPEAATGQFFTEFKPSMHKEAPFSILPHNAKGRLYGSVDIGTSHSTAFQLGYIDDDRVLHIIFTYCQNGYTIEHHARAIYDEIASNRFTGGMFPEIIWCDPAGFTQVKLNERSIRSPVDEFIDLFKSHNAITKFERANNSRANGCHIMRSMLSKNKIRYFDGYNKSYEEGMQSAITDKNNVESYQKVATDGDDVVDVNRYLAVGVSSLVTIGTQTDRPKTHLEKLLKGKLPHQQQKNNDFFAVGTKIGGI